MKTVSRPIAGRLWAKLPARLDLQTDLVPLEEVWMLMPSEVRKLWQLEEENARLRRLVADLSLDKEMLQEVIRKSYKACSTAEDGHKNTSPLLFPFDPMGNSVGNEF